MIRNEWQTFKFAIFYYKNEIRKYKKYVLLWVKYTKKRILQKFYTLIVNLLKCKIFRYSILFLKILGKLIIKFICFYIDTVKAAFIKTFSPETEKIKEQATTTYQNQPNSEQMAALSQIEAWKNQMRANYSVIKFLEKDKKTIKTKTLTINGDYDYLAVAKLDKKIATIESQNAGIEMRMRKLADKYNLQEELEDF